MSYQHLEPFSKQVTIVVGLTVVGFMAFGLALSFYSNTLFEQTLNAISAKNESIRQQLKKGERQLQYYHSRQYKDKYAKEHLGRITPGEKVLVITQKTGAPIENSPDDIMKFTDQQEAAYLEILRQMPIIEHWKIFLFHRDTMEELQKSFAQ